MKARSNLQGILVLDSNSPPIVWPIKINFKLLTRKLTKTTQVRSRKDQDDENGA